jgi:hypothetical protein
MANRKNKQVSANPADDEVFKPNYSSDELVRRTEEARKELPTTLELATLAALMSAGREISSGLADVAITMWKWCDERLENQANSVARVSIYWEKLWARQAERFQPKKFPVSLDEALRLVFENKSRPHPRDGSGDHRPCLELGRSGGAY